MTSPCPIQRDAPIKTWFRVGGAADRLARPRTLDELLDLVRVDPDLLVLGDGANLIVHDEGIAAMVVTLDAPGWLTLSIDPNSGVVRAGAGVGLPRLVSNCVRLGLAGVEGLGGVPATVGGAVVMNAGGRFGEIGSAVVRVRAVSRRGQRITLDRAQLTMRYRDGGLGDLIVTGVELGLEPGDPAALRDQLKAVLHVKKQSQPLRDASAGCCFKNPSVDEVDRAVLDEAPISDSRIPAGWLIERARCKGLRVGNARVSEHHANFIVTKRTATASQVIELMDAVRQRVLDETGVRLQREVKVWDRSTVGRTVGPVVVRSRAMAGVEGR